MRTTLLHHPVPVVAWFVVLAAALVAAAIDLRSRRIPNALTLPVLAAGLLHAALVRGLPGLVDAGLASLLLAAPYLLLFAFAGGGAGDVKLMAAVGAWLGLAHGLLALVCVSLAGVLVACVQAAARGRLGSTWLAVLGTARGATQALGAPGRTAAERAEGLRAALPPVPGARTSKGEVLTLPYGLAVLIGLVAAASLARALAPAGVG